MNGSIFIVDEWIGRPNVSRFLYLAKQSRAYERIVDYVLLLRS